jgi:hypothetical protein
MNSSRKKKKAKVPARVEHAMERARETEQLVEATARVVRFAKTRFKEARKTLKLAKKASKQARKEAKLAAKALLARIKKEGLPKAKATALPSAKSAKFKARPKPAQVTHKINPALVPAVIQSAIQPSVTATS